MFILLRAVLCPIHTIRASKHRSGARSVHKNLFPTHFPTNSLSSAIRLLAFIRRRPVSSYLIYGVLTIIVRMAYRVWTGIRIRRMLQDVPGVDGTVSSSLSSWSWGVLFSLGLSVAYCGRTFAVLPQGSFSEWIGGRSHLRVISCL